jgi:hypothetical protein
MLAVTLLKLQNRTQWQEKQDSSARAEARPQGQQRTDVAAADETAAAPAAADGGSAGEAAPAGGAGAPHPHAPAQNELGAELAPAPENRPAGAWRGPPGAN